MNHLRTALCRLPRTPATSLVQNSRTFFSRRSPFGLQDLSQTIREMERQFGRLDREMTSLFQDSGLARLVPFRYSPGSQDKYLPFVETESDDGSNYLLKIALGPDYAADDVKVSLKDRVLTINAKMDKTSKDGNSRVYQEMSKQFVVPENVKIEDLKSIFNPDGMLTIEAPLLKIEENKEEPKPKEIPIQKEAASN